MRITKEQEALLDSFVCQRLTMDPGNKSLVKNFICDRNPRLEAYLQLLGWKEDSEGATTFYVIKNQSNKILMFFSLKCGALFDPLNSDELEEQIRKYRADLEIIRRRNRSKLQDEELALAEQLRIEYGTSHYYSLEDILVEKVQHKADLIRERKMDILGEPNPKIARVVRTYPAVELVHFCVNDDARSFWNRCKFNRSMGEVLFWRFVAPIISDIRKTLGCQYVYLFAADDSSDGSLLNYYEVSLNFQQRDDIGANKPRYDFTCEFMCQNIQEMRDYRYDYFENFNPDPEDIMI